MKNFLSAILNVFKFIALLLFAIVVLPFAVIFVLYQYLIIIPIDAIRYFKSNYKKDLKTKYSRKVTESYGYRIYDYVKENPNIMYVNLEDNKFCLRSDSAIAFVTPYYNIFYENGELKYETEDENNVVTVHPFPEGFRAISSFDDSVTEKIKFLVTIDDFKDETAFELAKQDDLFVIINDLEDYKTIII